uniref:Uncharacterized protein n=1 Tax=Graphocephala atropunctata TaxID=36148 RepID=A0A1B6KG15_9HEMI
MKSISDIATAQTAYYALYESHLRYGIVVWGGTTVGNLQRVLKHQKRAIRVLGDLHPRQSCRETFRGLKILTVVNLYIQAAVTQLHTKTPEAVRTGTHYHNYNTRYASNYCLPVHHLTTTEKKPSYVGAKLWNSLPKELKKMEKKHFGNRLRSWLQEHSFYSLTEFYQWTDAPTN